MRDGGKLSPGILPRQQKTSPYHNSSGSLIPLPSTELGAALQQNNKKKEEKCNWFNLSLSPQPYPSPPLFLPESERKKVYWQAGLGAGDNNVGFVPR